MKNTAVFQGIEPYWFAGTFFRVLCKKQENSNPLILF